jgi:glucosamine--fructose-6-phosphate aminotransferase (isomerizing)
LGYGIVSLRDEIFEQPAAVCRLLDGGAADFASIAAAVARRPPAFAVIAARGSSDNAALYAKYLLAIRNGLVVSLAAPSTITLHRARPRMSEALVVGISQSGRSPDIVAVLDEARRQGALTVAVTNDPSSPLTAAAAHIVDLRAGPELSTAATKTYTTQLLAVALLSAALAEPTQAERADLEGMPGLMSAALTAEEVARSAASANAAYGGSVVLGRGYSYATAREWALKLQELAQVPAMPFSAADFEHGPLALADPGLLVLSVAPSGKELTAQLPLLRRLRREQKVRLLLVSNRDVGAPIDQRLPLPAGIPGWLSPLVEIVPAQLYTYHLTLARGLDPDRPRTISKVTQTI